MGILYAILFSRVIKGVRKINIKKTSKTIKRDVNFLVQLITELVELINKIVGFIFVKMPNAFKEHFCQATVKEDKIPNNVIDFDEYKMKKAE